MAKSESTAVNQLISLVQGGSPTRDEPSDDLFGPPKARVAAPRMTSTVPPLRGAGDVVPLPPQRAPTGTSQLNVEKPVRMVTAPPSRAHSIPPLPPARNSASKLPPPRPTPSQAAGTPPPTVLRTAPPATTLPPPTAQRAPAQPRKTPAGTQPAQPAQPAQARGTGPQRTTPPKTTPVAAPFDNPIYGRAPIDRTGDAISADNWFEASRMVEKYDETYVGTAPAPKRESASETLKKIMLPLVVLSVVSAGVAYVVFSHHAKKTAPPVTHVAAPAAKVAPAQITATPAAPSTESSNAATATAGGTQPEPPAPSAAPAAAPSDEQVAAHPNANDVKIVAKDSSHSAPEVAAPAAATPAAPVPAANVAAIAETAPVVHEVPTAHGTMKLVDVRIDSKPAGATVMLVDNGKTSFLGTTPVAASVDPTRSYDVVLTLEGRPTQMAHLDPTKAQKLEVTLSKTGAKAETPKAARVEAAPPKAASAPKAAPAKKQHVAASQPTGGLADPGFDAPAAPAPKADAGGEGTLMVSSKPPCEIWIDGKDTGLMTPQRSMSLPAGAHKVTFSNTDENITKTVTVKIDAGQSTKLIQNLMQ